MTFSRIAGIVRATIARVLNINYHKVELLSMQFTVKDLERSVNDIMRTIGYTAAYFQKEGEFSMVRKLSGGDYPRFHLYIRETPLRQSSEGLVKGKDYIFNLHLDQKKPSYEGSTKHSGDYEGNVVEEEVERIKAMLPEG